MNVSAGTHLRTLERFRSGLELRDLLGGSELETLDLGHRYILLYPFGVYRDPLVSKCVQMERGTFQSGSVELLLVKLSLQIVRDEGKRIPRDSKADCKRLLTS